VTIEYPCPGVIQGKAKQVWEGMVPTLSMSIAEYPVLEQAFFLLQEVYSIQDELSQLRKKKKTDAISSKIDSLNAQLVRTSRCCSGLFLKIRLPIPESPLEEERSLIDQVLLHDDDK
jgi:hypothetical protein